MDPRRRVLAAVFLGVSLAALDATIVGTIMPTVLRDLGGGAYVSFVFSAYLLCAAVTMPVFAKLSDMVRKRVLFAGAALLFIIGSVIAGLAPSMLVLVLARAVQGVGAGGLLTVPIALLAEVVPPEKRGAAIGSVGAVWAIASIVGPIVGGSIASIGDWRYAFYLNVPACAGALLLLRTPASTETPGRLGRVDIPGALVLGLGITVLLVGVGRLRDPRAALESWTLLLFAAAAGLLVTFGMVERWSATPLVPLSFFTTPRLLGPNVGAFLTLFIAAPLIAFVPLFALPLTCPQCQRGLAGGNSLTVAMVLIPFTVSWACTSIVGGRIADRMGPRAPATLGLLVVAAGLLGGGFALDATIPAVAVALVFPGVGLGLLSPSLLVAIQNQVPREQLGVATGTNAFTRNLGGSIGVGILGWLSGITGTTAAGGVIVVGEVRTLMLAAGSLAVFGALVVAATLQGTPGEASKARAAVQNAGRSVRPDATSVGASLPTGNGGNV